MGGRAAAAGRARGGAAHACMHCLGCSCHHAVSTSLHTHARTHARAPAFTQPRTDRSSPSKCCMDAGPTRGSSSPSRAGMSMVLASGRLMSHSRRVLLTCGARVRVCACVLGDAHGCVPHAAAGVRACVAPASHAVPLRAPGRSGGSPGCSWQWSCASGPPAAAGWSAGQPSSWPAAQRPCERTGAVCAAGHVCAHAWGACVHVPGATGAVGKQARRQAPALRPTRPALRHAMHACHAMAPTSCAPGPPSRAPSSPPLAGPGPARPPARRSKDQTLGQVQGHGQTTGCCCTLLLATHARTHAPQWSWPWRPARA